MGGTSEQFQFPMMSLENLTVYKVGKKALKEIKADVYVGYEVPGVVPSAESGVITDPRS